MDDPLALGTMNQIILSTTSFFMGSLEEMKASLAWRVIGPMVMHHLERVGKGFMSQILYLWVLKRTIIVKYVYFLMKTTSGDQ